MKPHLSVVMGLLFLFIPRLYAQQEMTKEAFLKLKEAKKSYSESKFEEAAELFKTTIELNNGNSSPYIQSMLIQSLDAIGDYKSCTAAITKYFSMSGAAQSDVTPVIRKIEVKTNDLIRKDQTAYALAEKKGTIRAYQEYIKKFRFAFYKDEAIKKIDSIIRTEFEAAASKNTEEAYKLFLYNYPEGAYSVLARKKISQLIESSNSVHNIRIEEYKKAEILDNRRGIMWTSLFAGFAIADVAMLASDKVNDDTKIILGSISIVPVIGCLTAGIMLLSLVPKDQENIRNEERQLRINPYKLSFSPGYDPVHGFASVKLSFKF